MESLEFKNNQDTFIIAEVAQAHDGNINFAHAFIDALAETGAHAVKFQTHFAEEESTLNEPWRVKFSHQDRTRFEYWQRMEFTKDQWMGLKKHAEEKGMFFLSSPFSLKAIELLDDIGTLAWKIGSGEVLSIRMLDSMIKTGKPIILSSGMSDYQEIDNIVANLKSQKVNYALMQCTTAYPTELEQVGLNVISEMKERYSCPIGLSDHTGTIWPSIAASALGAELIEVHVKIGNDMPGPDSTSSLTIEEFKKMVEGISAITTMKNSKIDKMQLTDDQKKMRTLFMKSIVARCDMTKGQILDAGNIVEKKPGEGLPAEFIENFFGYELKKSISKNEMLTLEHFSSQEQDELKKIIGI